MVIKIKKILVKQNLLKMVENKWDTKHIQILSATRKGVTEKVFIIIAPCHY